MRRFLWDFSNYCTLSSGLKCHINFSKGKVLVDSCFRSQQELARRPGGQCNTSSPSSPRPEFSSPNPISISRTFPFENLFFSRALRATLARVIDKWRLPLARAAKLSHRQYDISSPAVFRGTAAAASKRAPTNMCSMPPRSNIEFHETRCISPSPRVHRGISTSGPAVVISESPVLLLGHSAARSVVRSRLTSTSPNKICCSHLVKQFHFCLGRC